MERTELAQRMKEIGDLQNLVDRGTLPLAEAKDEILAKLYNIEILTGVGGDTLYQPLVNWARQGWMRAVQRNSVAEIETWRSYLVEVRQLLD